MHTPKVAYYKTRTKMRPCEFQKTRCFSFVEARNLLTHPLFFLFSVRHYAAIYPASAETAKMLAEAAPESMLVVNENGDTPLDKAKASDVDEDTVKFLKKKFKQASRAETSIINEDSESSLQLEDLMEPVNESPRRKKKSEDRNHESTKKIDKKESKKHNSSSKLSRSKSDLRSSSSKLSSSKSKLRTSDGDKESKKNRSFAKLSKSKSDLKSSSSNSSRSKSDLGSSSSKLSSSKSKLRTANGDKEEQSPRKRSSSRRRPSIALSPSKDSTKSPSSRRRSTKTIDASSPSNEDYSKSPSRRRRVKDDESRKSKQTTSSELEGSMASLDIEILPTPSRRAKKGTSARMAAGLPFLHPNDLESSPPKKNSSSSSRSSSRTSGTGDGIQSRNQLSPSKRGRSTKTTAASSPLYEDYTKAPSSRRRSRSTSKPRSDSRARTSSKDDRSRKSRQMSSSELEGSMAALDNEDLPTPSRRARKGSSSRISAGLPSLHPDDLDSSPPKKYSSSSSKRSSRTSGTGDGIPPRTPTSRKRDKVRVSTSGASSQSWKSPLEAPPTTPSTRRRSTRALLSPGQIPKTPSSKFKARMSESMANIGGPGGRSSLIADLLNESQHGQTP